MFPDLSSGLDPNLLAYFVVDDAGNRQAVHFEAISPEDEAELRGAAWSRAIFREVWPKFIGDPNALKLVCADDQDARIQGLVRLGSVVEEGGYFQNSLLEAAPANRARTVPRRYRGVGRVLIARLVAQSWVEGGRGKILVSPRPGTEPFYVGLGFRFVRPMRSALVLNEMGAATLMKAALMEGTRSKP